METFGETDAGGFLELAGAALLHGGFDEGGEIDPGAGVGVDAAGLFGEGAEGGAVEPGEDDCAALVFDEGAVAVGDHGAGAGADAETEDADALGFEIGDVFLPRVGLGFAVAEDDEETVGGAGGAEGGDGGFDESVVVGAALGQVAGVEDGQEFAEDFVVGTERALQEGGAGENDEPDAFAFEPFEETGDEQAGALETVGFYVVGQHAAGEIEGDDDFAGLVEYGFIEAAPLRAGEGGGRGGESEVEKPAGADGAAPLE